MKGVGIAVQYQVTLVDGQVDGDSGRALVDM